MPFRFSLQEVLEYRERIVEQRRSQMLAVQQEVQQIEELMEQAGAMRDRYRREMYEKSTEEGFSHGHREIYLRYIEGIDALLERSAHHLEHLREILEQRRQLLAEAARELEVMENLHDEERRLYLIEERRLEAKEYDEIAIRKFSARRREKIAAPGRETGK